MAPPKVTFREETAGRETLAAIAEDRSRVLHPLTHRGPAATKHYGDRISNAPGAVSPKTARALDTSPEISTLVHHAGQATLAAIDMAAEGPEISVSDYRPSQETYALIAQDEGSLAPEVIIHEDYVLDETEGPNLHALRVERIFTFVVGANVAYFRTDRQRQRLLDGRLLREMPGVCLADVTRIDVQSRGPDSMVVEVYVAGKA
jgi:hypothetical protein